MTQSRISAFTASEWREYRALRLRALKESPEAFCSTYSGSIQLPDEDWQERLRGLDPSLERPLVARVANVDAGMGWVHIDPAEPRTAHLLQMWVPPEHRGRGLGRELLSDAITWAKQNGASKMVLGVTTGDSPARVMYESAGFVAVGDEELLRSDADLMMQNMECAF